MCGILCHILRTYTNENHKELFVADIGVDGDSCACAPVRVVYAGLDVAVEAGVFPESALPECALLIGFA